MPETEMPKPDHSDPDAAENVDKDFWRTLLPPAFTHDHPPVRNANALSEERLSPMDQIAVAITDKVGSFGFFLIIFAWTVIWTGYNILASELPSLHWKAFDPFPAFVAYLLISNVIQILLMPLIMVGQNLQNRHSEIRAELDFETNTKAEVEVEILMRHIEFNTQLTVHLMHHIGCKLSDDQLHAIEEHQETTRKIVDEGFNPSKLADKASAAGPAGAAPAK